MKTVESAHCKRQALGGVRFVDVHLDDEFELIVVGDVIMVGDGTLAEWPRRHPQGSR